MYEKRKTKDRRKRPKQQAIIPALTTESIAIFGIIALMIWVNQIDKNHERPHPQYALPVQYAEPVQHAEPIQRADFASYRELPQYVELANYVESQGRR